MNELPRIGVDPYLVFDNCISDLEFCMFGFFISLVAGSVGGVGYDHLGSG